MIASVHMITYSQISDFTYINQLPKMAKVQKFFEEIFAIVSRFSNYFTTNRTRARNASLHHSCLLQASID